MSVELTTLPSGLRVVTDRMENLETASLGVWVAAGSRHERRDEHGLSHLLEHMAFKGTKRRTARDIAEEIETAGGDLNAATATEQTSYYAHVLAGDVPLGARYSRRHSDRERLRCGRIGTREGRDPARTRRRGRYAGRACLRSLQRGGFSGPGDRLADSGHARKCALLRSQAHRLLSRRSLSRGRDGDWRCGRGRSRANRGRGRKSLCAASCRAG